MLTIAPAPLCLRCGRHALAQWNAPSSVTPSTSRHSVNVISSNARSWRSAALLIEIVDAAELLRGVRHHRGHRLLVADVGDRRDRLAAVALDLAHDLLGLRPVGAHVDDDRGAARRERLRHRAADVAARAGDQRDAAGEFLFVLTAAPSDRCGHHTATCASFSAAFVLASSQPPWRQLSANLSSMSARVSGSLAPPRKCGWRSSTTLPSASVARIWPVNSSG